METEKDRLEREIKVLEEAREISANLGIVDATSIMDVAIYTKKEALSTLLSRPAIKDGVLGRWAFNEDYTIYDAKWHKEHPRYTFHPLTIEELLPTLAQWVPGAVRWRYMCSDRIDIYDGVIWRGAIPAPPLDDWETVGGEL